MATVEENSSSAVFLPAVKEERQRSSTEGRGRRSQRTQLSAWRQSVSRGLHTKQLHQALILTAGAIIAMWGLRQAFRKCLTWVTGRKRSGSVLAASSDSGSGRTEQAEDCPELRGSRQQDTGNPGVNEASVAGFRNGLRGKYFLSVVVLIVAIVAVAAGSNSARRRWRYGLGGSHRRPIVTRKPASHPPPTTQLPQTTPERFPVLASQQGTVFIGVYWVHNGQSVYNGGEPIEFFFRDTVFLFYLPKQAAELLEKRHMLKQVIDALSQGPVKRTAGQKAILEWGYREDAKFTFRWASQHETYQVNLPLEAMYVFMPTEKPGQKAALEDLKLLLRTVTAEIARVNEQRTVTLSEDSERSWWNDYFLTHAPPYEQIIAAGVFGTKGEEGYPTAHHFVETGGMGCIVGRGLRNSTTGLTPGFTFVKVPFDPRRNLYVFISQQAEEELRAGGQLRTFVEAMGEAPDLPSRWREGWVVYWGKKGVGSTPPGYARENILYKTRVPVSVTRALSRRWETVMELSDLLEASVQEFARLHLQMTTGKSGGEQPSSKNIAL